MPFNTVHLFEATKSAAKHNTHTNEVRTERRDEAKKEKFQLVILMYNSNGYIRCLFFSDEAF